jgi:RNA polymerase sigma-70 factor (ECF subfamily)
MDDREIVELFLARNEDAIAAAREQYDSYCMRIAGSILSTVEDAEECVGDTYWKAWNAIPPHEPENLATFLGKITRNLAFDRYAALTAEKQNAAIAVVKQWLDAL